MGKVVKLNSGYDMPMIGLGTWQAKPEEVKKAVETALNVGYRHIDTAPGYHNEEAIGETVEKWIQDSGNSREDIFLTTKLPCYYGDTSEDIEYFVNQSLKCLRVDYIDLYLIHMPFTFKSNSERNGPLKEPDGSLVKARTDHVQIWKKLEELVKLQKLKSIGVSNFNADQLKRLYEIAEIKPAVNQIELHAACQQGEMQVLCKELGVRITGYSPLGSPGVNTHFQNKYGFTKEITNLISHPTVEDLAKKYNRTPAQILLRFLVQMDVTVIPKSSNPSRIEENFKIFDFSLLTEDVEQMKSIDQGEHGRILDFLFFKGVENHPEYPFIVPKSG
uniref:Alcohol dehydrogenase [NADP(+)] A n=1 Tax=Cacopsylla melanoneura TaxID=428564 RepID=A0A8D9A9R2_9HEMI